jgi:hypothetical protein
MVSKIQSNPLIDAMSCPLVDFYRVEDYKPNESVGYLMRRILVMIAHEVERELEPRGLTHAAP